MPVTVSEGEYSEVLAGMCKLEGSYMFFCFCFVLNILILADASVQISSCDDPSME